MSVTDSTGRLHCPKCNARLAIPAHNRSPYIRCGVCHVLFQTEVEPSEIMEDRTPYPSAAPGPKGLGSSPQNLTGQHGTGQHGIGHAPQTAAERRMASRPQRPSPEYDWSRPIRPPGTSCCSTGKLALVALCFFGFLIFSLISWVDSSSSSHRRRSSSSFRTKSTTSQTSARRKVDSWKKGSYPKKEINLSEAGQVGKIKQGVDSIIVEERNLTPKELQRLHRTQTIRKIKYSNVTLTSGDLAWIDNKLLYELDLSHSKWPTNQVQISAVNFPYLIKLDLSDSSATDQTIWRLHRCRYLEEVNMRNTGVTDESIRFLLLHNNLKKLDVCKTQVTGESLVTLRNPSLEVLKVSPGVLDSKQRERIRTNNPQIRIIISI